MKYSEKAVRTGLGIDESKPNNHHKRWSDEDLYQVIMSVPCEQEIERLTKQLGREREGITDIWWFCYCMEGIYKLEQNRSLYRRVNEIKRQVGILDWVIALGPTYIQLAKTYAKEKKERCDYDRVGTPKKWTHTKIGDKEYFVNSKTGEAVPDGTRLYDKIMEVKTK